MGYKKFIFCIHPQRNVFCTEIISQSERSTFPFGAARECEDLPKRVSHNFFWSYLFFSSFFILTEILSVHIKRNFRSATLHFGGIITDILQLFKTYRIVQCYIFNHFIIQFIFYQKIKCHFSIIFISLIAVCNVF